MTDLYEQLLNDFYPKNPFSLDLPRKLYSNEYIKMTHQYEYDQYQNNDNETIKFNEIFSCSFNKPTITPEDISDEERYFSTIDFTRKKKVSQAKQNIFSIKKVKKVFLIKKTSRNGRKRGRMTIKSRPSYEPRHDRNSGDNIVLKIKRHIVERTRNYINKKYEEYLTNKKQKKNNQFLKKIIPNSYNVYNETENKEFLKKTLYQLFSTDISDKYNERNSKDYNRKQISKLFEENKAKELIEIMKLTMKEIYELYISNKIEGFNLESDLIKIEEKSGKDYRKKFQKKAENLIYFFSRNKGKC